MGRLLNYNAFDQRPSAALNILQCSQNFFRNDKPPLKHLLPCQPELEFGGFIKYFRQSNSPTIYVTVVRSVCAPILCQLLVHKAQLDVL